MGLASNAMIWFVECKFPVGPIHDKMRNGRVIWTGVIRFSGRFDAIFRWICYPMKRLILSDPL